MTLAQIGDRSLLVYVEREMPNHKSYKRISKFKLLMVDNIKMNNFKFNKNI